MTVSESTSQNWLHRPLIGTSILAVPLLVVTMVADHRDSLATLRADWSLIMPVVQLIGMVLVFYICGKPRHTLEAVGIAFLNAVLFVCPVLLSLGLFGLAIILGLELALRIGVVSIWIGAIAGPVLFMVTIRKGQIRWHPTVPALLAMSTWSLLIVILVEPIALYIDKTSDQPLSLPASLPNPPNGEIHVATIGGSTMLGHPYQPKYGIGEVLCWQLKEMYSDQKVVLHNLARGGANLKQALNCLNVLKVRPHLVILYSGHNESFHDAMELGGYRSHWFQFADGWLSNSPLFCCLDGVLAKRSALRQPRPDSTHFCQDHLYRPAIALARLERFKRHLELLAEFGQVNGIPMVWFVPTAAELTFAPNQSTLAFSMGSNERRQLLAALVRARNLESSGQFAEAVACYRAQLLGQPQLAEFQYRLGRCLYQLQKFDEARPHLQAALELDGYPIRATAEYRDVTASVSQQYEIPLIDAGKTLRPHTPHGILDSSIFHDNVHPTLLAYFILGSAAGKTVAQQRLIPKSFGNPGTPPSKYEDSIANTRVDLELLRTAYQRTEFGLDRLARYRFDSSERKQRSRHYGQLVKRIESGTAIAGKDGIESLGVNAGK